MQFDFSIFNPKSRPLIGLDISSSSVKLVELSDLGKGGYCVERYAIQSLPRDAVVDGNIANLEAVAEAVRRGCKALGSAAKLVAMALPASAVITRKIVLPADLGEQDMEAQVEAEANQYIPFALEEVNLDFQILGPSPHNPEEVELMIAASRKEKVEDRVAVAELAGLRPWVMDVETYATQAAFEWVKKQLPDEGRDQVIVLVDVGANILNVTILRNEQVVYGREQAFGGSQLTQEIMRAYGMNHEEAEAAKRSRSLPENYDAEILGPFLDNLALEVSRALQFFFTSTQFNQVDHIVLAGGCALIPGIDEVVAGRTQIKTIIANPFASMAIGPKVQRKKLNSDGASLLVACGLALRRFDP